MADANDNPNTRLLDEFMRDSENYNNVAGVAVDPLIELEPAEDDQMFEQILLSAREASGYTALED